MLDNWRLMPRRHHIAWRQAGRLVGTRFGDKLGQGLETS